MTPATRQRPGVWTTEVEAPWTSPKVPPLSAVGQLAEVLDSPEIAALVSELEATRWTGRPGYPIYSMIGMALAKSIYAVPTWTRVVALVSEHRALRAAITHGTPVPSVYACNRFAATLRTYSDLLARCIDRLKSNWALTPLRVRGLDRVRLHADLTILAKLTCTLARTRAVPLAA
jgi:hypothetical protein